MIDTHCHLDMFPGDAGDKEVPAHEKRDSVIRRAKDAGLEAIITIGSDLQSNVTNIAIAEKYDMVYASVGIHPHAAKDFTPEMLEQLKKWAKGISRLQVTCDEPLRDATSEDPSCVARHASRNKVVAIGETGLDYHYDHSPRDIQREVFRKHLALARETGLPAVIHSRDAKEDTLKILRETAAPKGVLHCFSGDREMAESALEMGLYISIAGPVTFRKAGRLAEIAKEIPDDYLLVETDAPYLAPEPLRGKTNEPSYIAHTIKRLAELRDVSPDDIARITTLNACRLFRIGELPARGEIAYTIRDSLYLNITNRCTNKCSFCVRFHSDYVKGHNLRLPEEPTEEELIRAIGDPSRYREVVFCGYGEPLLRLDTVKKVSGWVKERGGRVRINTNGHGNLIHGRNILPELRGVVDSVSVSLDAQDEETYNRICAPAFRNAFPEVISFIREAKDFIPNVQATVVEMEGVDIEKCRKITDELGVTLRVRKLDVVG
jgi:TatD DNase family protein